MTNTAFDEGYAAFQQGRSSGSCEHQLGSDLGREWLRGWTEAQMADREKAKGDGIAEARAA